jgi:hypothetical protein
MKSLKCAIAAFLMLAGISWAEETPLNLRPAERWHATGINLGPSPSLAVSEEKSPGSGPVLAFNYDLRAPNGEDSYCSYEYKDEILFDNLPKGIEVWIKGDKRQHPFRIQFVDRNNTVHQWVIAMVTWDTWKKVELPLKYGEVGYDQWGPEIPADLAKSKSSYLPVEPPLRFHALVVGSQETGERSSGTIKISDLKFKN